jgi:hypothetical protein
MADVEGATIPGEVKDFVASTLLLIVFMLVIMANLCCYYDVLVSCIYHARESRRKRKLAETLWAENCSPATDSELDIVSA